MEENESTVEAQESFELLPPEGHKDLGTRVYQILEEVISDKAGRGLHDKWLDHNRLSKSQPWRQEVTRVPTVNANLLHPHRQRTVNTLTDNDPTFNLTKCGAEAEETEEGMTAVKRSAEYWWREQEQQDILAASVDGGEMYGCAIEKLWFDADLEFGLGEVRTENVDAFQFGVYPTRTLKLQDAEAVLHFYPMSVRKARQRWPDKAKQIQADEEILKELGEQREEVGVEKQSTRNTTVSRLVSWFTSLFSANDSTDEGGSIDKRTLVVECWVKDYSQEKTVEVDPETDQEMEVTKLKYLGGIRRVTVCSAGKCVLEDKANPSLNYNLPIKQLEQTYLYDKFPFTITHSIRDDCSIWGQSDYEQLEGLQREFAKTLSQFGYFKDKAVRPKIINPKTSGVDNAEFTNSLGILNPVNDMAANAIKYMEMNNNGLMREFKGALELYKDLFFLVAGTFELEQAQTGSQVTAYKAIAALLEHAATMMRGKIRSYQRLIRERGRMYVSLAQNFYTEERFISYEDDGQTQTQPVNNEMLMVPARLTVVSGSTLPRAEIAKREEALDLFEKGAIDDMELLRALDWPNRAEVLRRKQLGLAGMLAERLGMIGVPQEIIDTIQQVAGMDDKEFQKAAEKGEIVPPQLPAPEEPGTDPVQQAEVGKVEAEIKKIGAEIMLKLEQAVSEKARQKQMLAGVAFDAEKLAMEEKKGEEPEPMPSKDRPGYNEKGMESNNVKEN